MTPPRRGNTPPSVRQRLLNLARERGENFDYLLTRYGLERFLYRLAGSPHRDRFILKGAMLFLLWGMDEHRPTRDADLLGFGENDVENLASIFREVCRVEVEDDGLRFDPDSVQAAPIREEMEYGGIRVTLRARLDGARISIQLDVGFGDAVTPGAEESEYPTLLDLPAPHLRIYPKETVIAEKFQAIVHLGMANSRMKDFYDIWVMARTFPFAGTLLKTAIERTFERRRTAIPAEAPLALTAEFFADRVKETQWRGFLRRNSLPEVSFEMAVQEIERFVMPLCRAIRGGEDFALLWTASGQWG
jgi:predicted nucleotidyltransferase component of viral defense system